MDREEILKLWEIYLAATDDHWRADHPDFEPCETCKASADAKWQLTQHFDDVMRSYEAREALIGQLVKLVKDCDNLLMEHHRVGFENEWVNGCCPACSKPSDGHTTIFYRIQAALASARERKS